MSLEPTTSPSIPFCGGKKFHLSQSSFTLLVFCIKRKIKGIQQKSKENKNKGAWAIGGFLFVMNKKIC
jgi:hypothetical protein